MLETSDLSVTEALQRVLDAVSVLPAERVPLLDALSRVLAAPVVARDSLPPFANSSMDGYALRAADLATATADSPVRLRVIGEVAAGSVLDITVIPGTAVRIMTGAPLPKGADAVIPVEDTSEPWRDPTRPLPEVIEIGRIRAGDYVRYPGEDVRAGEEVLPKGHLVRPQEIGVMASLGVAEVEVVRRPRVAVLATGDELIPVDEPLTPGKIRNSNSYAQAAQVASLGAIPVMLPVARDTEEDVRRRLQEGIDAGVDLIISSAGVSVGVYDVVKSVLEQDGNVGFWRVRMRPGKPLAFGAYRGIPYLGLPGNPVSAMVSFDRFARPAILKMAGHTQLERPSVIATVRETIHSDGRESYLRAIVSRDDEDYSAVTTGGQGSHMMTSLVRANALLIVPEGVTLVEPGMQLTALLLDRP